MDEKESELLILSKRSPKKRVNGPIANTRLHLLALVWDHELPPTLVPPFGSLALKRLNGLCRWSVPG